MKKEIIVHQKTISFDDDDYDDSTNKFIAIFWSILSACGLITAIIILVIKYFRG